jgi:lysophospholipase L1-like esterase
VRPHRCHTAVVALVLCLVAIGCSSPATDAAPTPPSMPPISEPSVATEPARPVLRYVALGDSLASGMGGEASYADFYARGLQRQTVTPVELTNLGRPGWTSAQLLEALRTSAMFRTAVTQADIITWDIGGNDIIRAVVRSRDGTCGGADGLDCVRETTEDFATHWDAITDELVALRRDENVSLRTFDLYTPFVPPGPRTDELLAELGAMNATIAASDGYHGIKVAHVAAAFEGALDELIDDDGLHPSRAGHRRIAELLLALDEPSTG